MADSLDSIGAEFAPQQDSLESISKEFGGDGGVLGKVRTALETDPTPLLGKLGAQAEAGFVDSASLGYIKPRVDSPEDMAQQLARASGAVGGFVLPYSRIAAVVKTPALAGAVMGFLQDTDHPIGSKEDLLGRAKGAGLLGAQMAAFSWAGKKINEKVTSKLLDGAFRGLSDPAKKQILPVLSKVIGDMTLGAGLGVAQDQPDDKNVQQATGMKVPDFMNIKVPFTSPNPKREAEMRIASGIVGMLSMPIGGSMGEQFGRLAMRGDLAKHADAINASDDTVANQQAARGYLGLQQAPELRPQPGLEWARALYPETYMHGIVENIKHQKALEASYQPEQDLSKQQQAAPSQPASDADLTDIQKGKVAIVLDRLKVDHKDKFDSLHTDAGRSDFNDNLYDVARGIAIDGIPYGERESRDGVGDANHQVKIGFMHSNIVDHSTLQNAVETATPDRHRFMVGDSEDPTTPSEAQKRMIGDWNDGRLDKPDTTDTALAEGDARMAAEDKLGRKILDAEWETMKPKSTKTRPDINQILDDHFGNIPTITDHQRAMHEAFGGKLTSEQIIRTYSGGAANVWEQVKAKVSEMFSNEKISHLITGRYKDVDGVVNDMMKSFKMHGLGELEGLSSSVKALIADEIKARGLSPKESAAKLEVKDATGGIVDPAPGVKVDPDTTKFLGDLKDVLLKDVKSIGGGSPTWAEQVAAALKKESNIKKESFEQARADEDMPPTIKALDTWQAKHEKLAIGVLENEKHGDMTPEQQALLDAGDWKAFSKARGYTTKQINQFQDMLNSVETGVKLMRASYPEMTREQALEAVQGIEWDARNSQDKQHVAEVNALSDQLYAKHPDSLDAKAQMTYGEKQAAAAALIDKNTRPTQTPHEVRGVPGQLEPITSPDDKNPMWIVLKRSESKYQQSGDLTPKKIYELLKDRGKGGGLLGQAETSKPKPHFLTDNYASAIDAARLMQDSSKVIVGLHGDNFLKFAEGNDKVRVSHGENGYDLEFFGDGHYLPKEVYTGVQYLDGAPMETVAAWMIKAIPEGSRVEQINLADSHDQRNVDPRSQEEVTTYFKGLDDAFRYHRRQMPVDQNVQMKDMTPVLMNNVRWTIAGAMSRGDQKMSVAEAILDGVQGIGAPNRGAPESDSEYAIEASHIQQDPKFYHAMLEMLKSSGVLHGDAQLHSSVNEVFLPKSNKSFQTLSKELDKSFFYPPNERDYVSLEGMKDADKAGNFGFPEAARATIRLMAKYPGSSFVTDDFGRIKMEVRGVLPEDKPMKQFLNATMAREMAKLTDIKSEVKKMEEAIKPLREIYDKATAALKSGAGVETLNSILLNNKLVLESEVVQKRYGFNPPATADEAALQYRMMLNGKRDVVEKAKAWNMLQAHSLMIDVNGKPYAQISRTRNLRTGQPELEGGFKDRRITTAEAHEKEVNRLQGQIEMIDKMLDHTNTLEDAMAGRPFSVGNLHVTGGIYHAAFTAQLGEHLKAIDSKRAQTAAEVEGLQRKVGIQPSADLEKRRAYYKTESDIRDLESQIKKQSIKIDELSGMPPEPNAEDPIAGKKDEIKHGQMLTEARQELLDLEIRHKQMVTDQRTVLKDLKSVAAPPTTQESAQDRSQLSQKIEELAQLDTVYSKFSIIKEARSAMTALGAPLTYDDMPKMVALQTNNSLSVSDMLRQESESMQGLDSNELSKIKGKAADVSHEDESMDSQRMIDLPYIGGGSKEFGDFIRGSNKTVSMTGLDDPAPKDAVEVMKNAQFDRDLVAGKLPIEEQLRRLVRTMEAKHETYRSEADRLATQLAADRNQSEKLQSMDDKYDWKRMTFGERFVKGLGYWWKSFTGELSKEDRDIKAYNTPKNQNFIRMGEAVYFDPQGKMQFTERGKTEKLATLGGQTRQEFFLNAPPDVQRNVANMRRILSEKMEANIGMGVLGDGTVKGAEAVRAFDKELGYMPSVPLDNKTGKPFNRSFRGGPSSKELYSRSRGENETGTRTSLDDRLKTGNLEEYDPTVLLRHYLGEFANRSSAEYVLRNLENNFGQDGKPLLMFKGERTPYRDIMGTALSADDLKAATANGTRVPISREISSLTRYRESAFVHPDLVAPLNDYFGNMKPAYGGQGYNRIKAFNKSVILWNIGDNMTMLYGAATGAMGVMKATDTLGRIVLGKPPDLDGLKLRFTKAGWLGASHNISQSFYDNFEIQPDAPDGNKNLLKRAVGTLEFMAKDKFGLDKFLFKSAETISLAMCEAQSDQHVKMGADRETADKLASDFVNTTTYNRGRYALDRDTSNAARLILISQNMVSSRIATLTGAFGYKDLASIPGIGKIPGVDKLDGWFSRNFGLHGYTDSERSMLAKSFQQHWMRIGMTHALGGAMLSYMMTGVWPWQRQYNDWFKIGTNAKDANGNGILVSNPMLKDFTDNQAFWNIPVDILTSHPLTYLMNKGDMTFAGLAEVATGQKITGYGAKPIVDDAAPFNAKVSATLMHIFVDRGPLGAFRQAVVQGDSGEIDPLASLGRLMGVNASKSLGGIGQESIEYMKNLEIQRFQKYQRTELGKVLDEYRKTGDPRYAQLLVMLKASPQAMMMENLKVTNPLLYQQLSMQRNLKQMSRLSQAEAITNDS